MTGQQLALHGCTPTPLACYLKALGVLRLVSSPANHVSGEAADPHARGWWENECFHLRTTLSRDALLHFFLHDYAPSPIIAPWNGGSGFYSKDNKDGFDPLAVDHVAERFGPMSSTIRNAARTVADLQLTERPEATTKVDLVAVGRPQSSWTRIKGESDVTRRWGYGSVEAGEGSWVGADGGSPEGDRSRRRRGGDGVGGLGAGTTVEREPETGCGVAAAA